MLIFQFADLFRKVLQHPGKLEFIALLSIIPLRLHQTISLTPLSLSCSDQKHRFPI